MSSAPSCWMLRPRRSPDSEKDRTASCTPLPAISGAFIAWDRASKNPVRLKAKFWMRLRSLIGAASATAARETLRCSPAAGISTGPRATGALGRALSPDASRRSRSAIPAEAAAPAPLPLASSNTRSTACRGRRAGGFLRRDRLLAEERGSQCGGRRNHAAQLSLPELPFFPLRRPTALRFRPSASPTGVPRHPRLDIGTSQTLNYAKGYAGARWSAFDEDGDSLVTRLKFAA